ncbi:MAG TPA: hypothetical protein VH475_02045 [Tepidisphaeraceae bacterium]|jgi:hypothetical protein
MAQTAVDLPDPMEESGDGGAPNSADDLLSQLAGEEIDRLLAQADELGVPEPRNVDRPADPAPAARTAPAAPAPATPGPTTAATETAADPILDATEAALDDLFKELKDDAAASDSADPAPAPKPQAARTGEKDKAEKIAAAVLGDPSIAPAPAAPKPADQLISERAEDLIAQVKRDGGMVPAPAAEDDLTEIAEPSAAADLAAELDADEAAHAAAVTRITKAPNPASNADESAAGLVEITEGEVDESTVVYERVPLVVRVLEWVNAPLASLSWGGREAVGKVAIATALNAIAILVYLLLFRRH